MYYYKIAVFTKTKNKYDTFTYQSTEKIDMGEVVLIPFGPRKLYGLVLEKEKTKPEFITKDILKILDEKISIPNHLIQTAFFMADYYHIPISLALKTMLPLGFHKKRQKKIEKISEIKTESIEKPKLKQNQKEALEEISKIGSKKPILLFGVTGSGKTEIYLRVIEECLKEGKGAIVLVPEIALTPQTIERFESRFPGKTVLIHSQLKETERQNNWELLKNGDKKIVIGSRSAIFAPIENLGAIIIDEEHETSYKQENSPRYDARKIAEHIAKLKKITLIFGSATPRIESFYKGKNNVYKTIELQKRIFQEEMPEVDLVNMTNEFSSGRKSFLSLKLEDEIKKTLENKKKVILFLNRRGNSTYVFCRSCGYVEKCPKCDIPLVHHLSQSKINSTSPDQLKCHHCDFKKETPKICPSCESPAIKFYGLGIQKAESELNNTFKESKVIRIDRDVTKEKGSHKKIYESFKYGDADILLGTQMIAKGWDLAEVDLVGVISIDYALNLPDFRSSERIFQLLTQVSGRTGRKHNKGKVIIQTYNTESYPIICSQKHDYKRFYEKEIKEREQFFYPPFSKLIRLEYRDKKEDSAFEEALRMKETLEKEIKEHYNNKLIQIAGPNPSFLKKINDFYRWNLLLKIDKESDLKSIIKLIPEKWIIDIDPFMFI